MKPAVTATFRLVRDVWDWLRAATGDDAYERYAEHHGTCHAGESLLTRAQFYEERQRRKWSGVSRCC
ncbi:MAG TPA: YbdD/YjiX family protein [Steroidobacteraceae bacterium]|nr:YbdD/YjiX family protein [Steroidobacteraceae bacterium]